MKPSKAETVLKSRNNGWMRFRLHPNLRPSPVPGRRHFWLALALVLAALAPPGLARGDGLAKGDGLARGGELAKGGGSAAQPPPGGWAPMASQLAASPGRSGQTPTGQTLPGQALPSLIPLTEPAGLNLLAGSGHRADYGALAGALLTQANLAYCGVASSAMLLNSLAVPAPAVPGYGPYRFWTQENLFDDPATRLVKAPELIARQGMTLDQLRQLLASKGVKVRAIHGLDIDLLALRRLLASSLANPTDRLLVNYDRRLLGQTGGGHIAPLAAYHAASNRALILDVARYRYPSVWVPLKDLWQSMRSLDSASGLSRGLVVVER